MKKLLQVSMVAAALSLGMTTGAFAATPAQQPSETAGQYANSTGLTAKVKAAFVQTSGLNSNDINVKTYKGTVLLSGFVENQAQSQLAEQTAENVAGVQKVENHLVVKSN